MIDDKAPRPMRYCGEHPGLYGQEALVALPGSPTHAKSRAPEYAVAAQFTDKELGDYAYGWWPFSREEFEEIES